MLLKEVLRNYTGKRIYYKPNNGNGGDALIAASAFDLFDEYGIHYSIIENLAEFDATNECIFYPGGGNLIDLYDDCADFFRHVHRCAKEIILMPHTINGHADLIREFGENITLIAREEETIKFLTELNLKCNIMLDHDLAFSLKAEDYLSDLSEYTKSLVRQIKWKKIKSFNFNFEVLNAFRTDSEKHQIQIPRDNVDVSALINYRKQMDNVNEVKKTVTDFLTFLSKFELIRTDRLHVAIGGCLLGIKTELFPNSYWKNRAVFDYSMMSNFNNIKFLNS